MKRAAAFLFLLLCVLPSLGHAATRYVDGALASDCPTGNYSIAARNCTGANGAAWNTIAEGLANTGAGDTLYIRAGTYGEAINNLAQTVPSGTSFANAPLISGYTTEQVTLNGASGSAVINLYTTQYLIFQNLTLNGINLDATFGQTIRLGTNTHHIRFSGVTILKGPQNNVLIFDSASFNEFINVKSHDGGTAYPPPNNPLGGGYGFYVSGDSNLFDHTEVYNNTGYGFHVYNSNAPYPDNNIIRNSLIYNNSLSVAYNAGILLAKGSGNIAYNNVVRNNPRGIETGHGDSGSIVYSNTVANNYYYGIYLGNFSSSGTAVRNNITYQNGSNNIFQDSVSALTISNNLCQSTGTGCAIVGNPGFVSAAGGDFHISSAGSAAVNAGATLGSPYDVDSEGITRPAGAYTVGAYQFATTPVGPFGNVARYTFEEGTGTTAADSEVGTGAGGHTCVLNSAGWGAGIIGTWSFTLDGTRWCQITGTADLRPTTEAGLSAWINSTSTTGSGVGFIATLQGDAFAIFVRSSGVVGCQVIIGGTFFSVEGGSVLTGTNRHVSCSYKSGDGLRLRLDNAQIGFLSLSGSLDYSLGTNAQIGRSELTAGLAFVGRMDQVYIFDQEITASGNTNLFNEVVPSAGLSVTHLAWFTANTVNTPIGSTDTDLSSWLITLPLGIRWALHKSDAGSLTEYFRPFCRVNTGSWGSWIEVGNSFGSLGVRFYADSAISVGGSTSVLLPTDGFTGIAGIYLENPVDTTSPYDAIQRLTIAQFQHAELEARVEFGAPLTAGNLVECRPYRENGTDFGASNYANIKTITLQALGAPSSVRLGGIFTGGTLQ